MKTLEDILAKARRVESDLRALDLNSLALTEIGKSYFQFNLTKLKFISEINSFILYHLIKEIKIADLSKITIIDHGAGIGFLGLLAKRIGVSKIICHDISSDMIHDCQIISEKFGVPFDHYVVGDTTELVNYCNYKGLVVHGLASRNVIEHVYDLNDFFSQLSQIPGKNFIMIITTSANIHNPVVHWQHKKIHHQYEYDGANTDMMKSDIQKDQSGRNVRKKIIKEIVKDINDFQLDQLITNTRGLVLEEIQEYARHFKLTGEVLSLKEKLSNTLDPYHRSWVERLVPWKDYKNISLKFGFEAKSIGGFYNKHYRSLGARIASSILNLFIIMLPAFHRNISPFLAMKFIRKH